MGSPLAVFLALRGIRPGSTGSQDHILPREICNRLLNIFHPTDPVVSYTADSPSPSIRLFLKNPTETLPGTIELTPIPTQGHMSYFLAECYIFKTFMF